MASTTVLAKVQGTLSTLVNEQYVTYNVTFDIEVKQLRGSRGVEDEAVSRVSLVPGHNVPDGSPYTARYSYHGRNYDSPGLRVNGGQLLAG